MIHMKVHKRWYLLMLGMIIIAIAGLFASEPTFTCDFSKINAADVAWLITATIRDLYDAAELYCDGTDQRALGRLRIQLSLWR